jgi:hypothetical protein
MNTKRKRYTLEEFLRAAEIWITFSPQERPYEELDTLSPLHYAKPHELEDIPSLAL